MQYQKTVRKEISYSGIGVHTGNKTTITFKPASVNHGVKFLKKDSSDESPIEATIDNVIDVARGTTLGNEKSKIHTVEHVLAALMGFGIDNLLIEVDANEPPVGDGSSMPFVQMIQEAGIKEQEEPKRFFTPKEPIFFSEDNISLIVLPSDKMTISFTISYNTVGLDTQYISLPINEETFVREIAPSRTFCFYDEVEHLMESGLIKGGSLDNAVVIKDEAVLSKEGLRFKNEFVRHKVLDLMGDLYLLGRPILAHVIAIKSGHLANIKLTRLLKEKIRGNNPAEITNKSLEPHKYLLDTNEIMNILPHRYPFLMVDYIIEIEEDKKIVGLKNVSANEPFFAGHFPGHPIMPGVLVIEAMAQVGAIMLLKKSSNEGKIAYFMTVDNCKFRKPVLPGDQLRLEAEVMKIRSKTSRFKTRAYVGETLVAEAELMCSLVDREQNVR